MMMSIGSQRKYKILHVDDDNLALELTKMYLERLSTNLELIPFTSSTKALSSFREQRFDCVISDFHMPVLDGLAFLRRVRELDPNVPFVLLSGDDRDDVAVTAMISGVDDYIVKGNHSEHYADILSRIHKLINTAPHDKSHDPDAFNRVAAMLDELSSPTYIVSDDNNIVFNNSKFVDLYGNSIKKKCYEVVFSAKEHCTTCFTKDSGEVISPFVIDHRNEGDRLVRMFYHPLRTNDGRTYVVHMILNTLH